MVRQLARSPVVPRSSISRRAAAARPAPDGVTQAFWYACHGGQQAVAGYLLERGAELNWVSTWDGLTPLDAARRSGADEFAAWLAGRGGKPAGKVDGHS